MKERDLKFKVGDRVRIIGEKTGFIEWDKNIGNIDKIIHIDTGNDGYPYVLEKLNLMAGVDELELVEEDENDSREN